MNVLANDNTNKINGKSFDEIIRSFLCILLKYKFLLKVRNS
jgi:hypothetical protein